MLRSAIVSLSTVLFFFLYLSIRSGLAVWWDGQTRKRRLHIHRESALSARLTRIMARFVKPYRHLSDLLTALRWRLDPRGFAVISMGMALLGIAAGVLVFQTLLSVLILLVMFGALPYVLLRMTLINRQMSTRLEFLPAVELFYQCYLVTGSRQIRIGLQKTVEERRLPGEVQAVFEQLYRNLSVKGDDEGSLRRFSLSFGHSWADYFISIVKVSLEEGNNVADNLKELIADMRKAQLANQLERHRLLEIRLANFAPALVLGLFLAVNFRLNAEASYLYYFVDAKGRAMLLNSVVMLFASMLMGIYLSRRRI